MEERKEAMVLGSFVGDSLALGAHWIYDTREIADRFGRVDRLLAPGPKSYHPTKGKGAFTHYGDQAMVLLRSLAAMRAFDLEDFSARWRALFKDYTGYVDQASRATLSRYASGKGPKESGSPSDDLAGAARIAPLVYLYGDDPDALLPAVRAQTLMTHNHPLVADAAEFFSWVAYRALRGESPVAAMTAVAESRFKDSPIFGWMADGMASKAQQSVAAIGRLGQSCHMHQAFAAVVHLVARFESDLKEALVHSVMSGGDSAARGMVVGMVLGAYLGTKALPAEWLCDMKAKEEIMTLLRKLS